CAMAMDTRPGSVIQIEPPPRNLVRAFRHRLVGVQTVATLATRPPRASTTECKTTFQYIHTFHQLYSLYFQCNHTKLPSPNGDSIFVLRFQLFVMIMTIITK